VNALLDICQRQRCERGDDEKSMQNRDAKSSGQALYRGEQVIATDKQLELDLDGGGFAPACTLIHFRAASRSVTRGREPDRASAA
jgi:hypothetical protein